VRRDAEIQAPGHTLQLSEQQVPVGPLVDPVLQGTALLLHLRPGPGDQSGLATQPAILQVDPLQVRLHRGVGDRVGWPVHQVDRDNPGGRQQQR